MADTVTLDAADVQNLHWQVETLSEQLAEATLSASRLLALDDRGWATIAGTGEGDVSSLINRDAILDASNIARVMAALDPLIKRGVNLRIAYLGVPDISADDGSDGGQDVNAVIQAFLDDPGNRDAFSSAQAFEERERARNTDGNHLHALITAPMTGRVQARKIPMGQIEDIVTDPEDASTPWLYLRQWRQRVVEQGYTGSTRSRIETRRAYYPDINYRPAMRARTIDGVPVEWDKPVVHTAVNRPEGSRWGIPDVLAAIPWARGYRDALQDWAKHNKALASIAFQATVKNGKAANAVRAKIPAADGEAGRTVTVGEGQALQAVNTSGASMNASAAEPLAGMVAAALDVPKTMLLADPGTTGARAVAETLDRPMELDRKSRRRLDTDLIEAVLLHVIREAVRAPRGPLRGKVIRDDNGREVIELANGQDPGIAIDWPQMEKIDLKSLVEALALADGMDVVPPLVLARLVLLALGIDHVDEVLDELTDDDGNFLPPSQKLAAAGVGYDGAGRDR